MENGLARIGLVRELTRGFNFVRNQSTRALKHESECNKK